MSSFDMILMRDDDRVAELHRRAHDVVEDPVDAVADAQLLLVRLDVDVARALLNGRHQHDVHQPDDRRVLALLGERVGADLLQLLEDLDVAACCRAGLQFLEALAGHFEGARAGRRAPGAAGVPARPCRRRPSGSSFWNRVDDRRFRRDDRLHVVAGHELDVVHREDVRRIRHRDRQRRARPAQRDDLVLLRRLGRDQLDDRRDRSRTARG